ncbi:MFS transporter [Geobacillus thermodenitrificans]|uniref:MFS transporter n=1 Tax=Geobacillus thermodenitrificans TaxID=33940 RepID=UPI002E21FA57
MSQLGSVIFTMALNWWIVDMTGSAKILGVVTAISLIPSVFINLFGGVVSDRFNKRNILILMDIIAGSMCILLGFFTDNNSVNIPLVIAVNIALSISFSLFSPTMRAIIPEIIDENRIKKINSYLTTSSEIIKVSGPIVGAWLLSLDFIGISMIFIINGVSFLISAFMEFFIKYSYIQSNKVKSYFEDFVDGFKYVKRDPLLIRLLVAVSLVNFFIAGYNIILPVLVNFLYKDSSIYSLALSSEALGGIVGAFLLSFSKGKAQLVHISRELILCGSVFLLLIFFSNLYVLYGVIFFFGFFLTRFNVLFFTYIQTNIDKTLLGRVFSFIFTIAIVFMPIGNTVFGFLGDYFYEGLLPIIGTGIVLSVILLFFSKSASKDKHTYKGRMEA